MMRESLRDETDEPNRRPTTSMLAFCCANAQAVQQARRRGLRPREAGLPVYEHFEEARAACMPSVRSDRLLVIDAYAARTAGDAAIDFVPARALANADPYLEPFPVRAAGGFVTRRRGTHVDLLLIFRRAVWDLPKGKLDRGESIRECAEREVREELGIGDVRIVQALGTTVHGYAEGSGYAVKTTWWFEMETSEETFTPQLDEGIERADWVSWRRAAGMLGYETLRQHAAAVERLVHPPGQGAG